VIQIAI